jgi:hypothetical protein
VTPPAEFYVDHMVARRIVWLLRALGYLAVTTAELGRDRAKDPDQLLYAAQRNWIVLTHNRNDFEMLHEAWIRWSEAWNIEPVHSSILVTPPHLTARDTVANIEAIATSNQPITNQLYRYDLTTGTWARFVLPRP